MENQSPNKNRPLHVAIVGSRNYEDLNAVRRFVIALGKKYPRVIIVSGGAQGPDKAAEQQAIRLGLRTKIFKADWNRNGKAAGVIRNTMIVDSANVLVAFWDGSSNGTKDSLRKAQKRGIPVFVYDNEGRIVADWYYKIR